MVRRAVVVAAIVAGLCAPVPAQAAETTQCVPTPVDTVGLHVRLGDEEAHVPAVSNAQLCVALTQPVGERLPAGFATLPDCGFPCFLVEVESGPWTVMSMRLRVYVTYDADGVSAQVSVADLPVDVIADNPNPVCLAMGNPIPDCPPNSIAVPLPAP